MRKKLLAAFLAFVMTVSLLPMAAFAAGSDEPLLKSVNVESTTCYWNEDGIGASNNETAFAGAEAPEDASEAIALELDFAAKTVTLTVDTDGTAYWASTKEDVAKDGGSAKEVTDKGAVITLAEEGKASAVTTLYLRVEDEEGQVLYYLVTITNGEDPEPVTDEAVLTNVEVLGLTEKEGQTGTYDKADKAVNPVESLTPASTDPEHPTYLTVELPVGTTHFKIGGTPKAAGAGRALGDVKYAVDNGGDVTSAEAAKSGTDLAAAADNGTEIKLVDGGVVIYISVTVKNDPDNSEDIVTGYYELTVSEEVPEVTPQLKTLSVNGVEVITEAKAVPGGEKGKAAELDPVTLSSHADAVKVTATFEGDKVEAGTTEENLSIEIDGETDIISLLDGSNATDIYFGVTAGDVVVYYKVSITNPAAVTKVTPQLTALSVNDTEVVTTATTGGASSESPEALTPAVSLSKHADKVEITATFDGDSAMAGNDKDNIKTPLEKGKATEITSLLNGSNKTTIYISVTAGDDTVFYTLDITNPAAVPQLLTLKVNSEDVVTEDMSVAGNASDSSATALTAVSLSTHADKVEITATFDGDTAKVGKSTGDMTPFADGKADVTSMLDGKNKTTLLISVEYTGGAPVYYSLDITNPAPVAELTGLTVSGATGPLTGDSLTPKEGNNDTDKANVLGASLDAYAKNFKITANFADGTTAKYSTVGFTEATAGNDTLTSGTPSADIPCATLKSVDVYIVVTKGDATSYYKLTVTNPEVTPAGLSALTVSGGSAVSPSTGGADDSSSETLTSTLTKYSKNFTITATFAGEAKYFVGGSDATKAEDGTPLVSGTASSAITAEDNDTVVYIYVDNGNNDQDKSYYTLTVKNGTVTPGLTALSVDGTTVSPGAATGGNGTPTELTATMAARTTTFTLNATFEGKAYYKVGSAASSSDTPLTSETDETITIGAIDSVDVYIFVDNINNQTTAESYYKLTVSKPAAKNGLRTLVVDTDTALDQSVSTGGTSDAPEALTATLGAYATEFTITATFDGSVQYSTVDFDDVDTNGIDLTSGTASDPIDVTTLKTITLYIVVTNEDASKSYYTLTVTNPDATAGLQTLVVDTDTTVNGGVTTATGTAEEPHELTATLGANAANFTITATFDGVAKYFKGGTDAAAAKTGTDLESGEASGNIATEATGGDTVVYIYVANNAGESYYKLTVTNPVEPKLKTLSVNGKSVTPGAGDETTPVDLGKITLDSHTDAADIKLTATFDGDEAKAGTSKDSLTVTISGTGETAIGALITVDGDNTIIISVKSGTKTVYYSLTINNPASDEPGPEPGDEVAELESLSVNGANATGTFTGGGTPGSPKSISATLETNVAADAQFSVTASFTTGATAKIGDDISTVKDSGTALSNGSATTVTGVTPAVGSNVLYIYVVNGEAESYYKLIITNPKAEVPPTPGNLLKDTNDREMIKGEKLTLETLDEVNPKNATWESDNTAVATVDKTGKVTAKASGTATITVTIDDTVDTVDIIVYTVNKITSLVFADNDSAALNDTYVLEIGETEMNGDYTLTFEVADTDDEFTMTPEPTVTTSKATVATAEVVLAGDEVTLMVTAVGPGTATIKVTVGGKSATLKLTVGKALDENWFIYAGDYEGQEDGGSVEYTGKAHKPKVVRNPDAVDAPTDLKFKVTYATDDDYKSVGSTITVTVTGSGNYVGEFSWDLSITPVDLESAESIVVKGLTKNGTYKGKDLNPKITVKVGKTTLKLDRDYTVTWTADPVHDADDYTLSITGVGNYTGTISADDNGPLTYTVDPVKITRLPVKFYSAVRLGGASSMTKNEVIEALIREIKTFGEDTPAEGSDYTISIVTYESFRGGDYDTEPGTFEAGKYVIVFKYVDGGNYTQNTERKPYLTKTFTIRA